MNNTDKNSIVIIGAGLVGLTLAARLAGFEIRSTVLDKSPHLMPKGSKACLIQGDALKVLDKIGCSDKIAEEGISWLTAHTYVKNVERIMQHFQERVGFGLTFPPNLRP